MGKARFPQEDACLGQTRGQTKEEQGEGIMEPNTVAAVETEKKSTRKARKRERGAGGLVKKPGSRNWYLLYYDLNGKQHSESSGTRSKELAQTMLTSRLEAVRKGE